MKVRQKSLPLLKSTLAFAITGITLNSSSVHAQSDAENTSFFEEIIVTAQKRSESLQDVPISISVLSGDRLASKFTGGESVLALAASAPGLYAESSNGRSAPRFYMRGLGNADFDQAASQPVSFVMDEVPLELAVLKSFPIFDIGTVEVIRGPQGTLFGRNTTAGIIHLKSRRPTSELEGYAKLSAGSLGTRNIEAAVGGSIGGSEMWSGRLSVLSQNRDDWISNTFTGENDAIGGFEETAFRGQLQYELSDTFSALLLVQTRDTEGNSASAFRANILTKGSNSLNSNFERDEVFHDGGANNLVEIEGTGINLRLEWQLGDYSLSSITARNDMDQFGRGDIDGGVAGNGPGFILFSSDTGGYNSVEQFTQEIRLASSEGEAFNWQVGAFYFQDEISTSTEFGSGPNPKDLFTGAIGLHENTAWAIFGQGNYNFNDTLSLTVGVRYTEDEKDYTPVLASASQDAINLSDSNVSWDAALEWANTDTSQFYGRIASGFRAPSIQSRNAAFGQPVTTAESETIMSFEAGYKAELSDRVRLNVAIFHYVIDDMQLVAIGGSGVGDGGSTTTLLNADGGTGTGFEFDLDWAVTENLVLTAGYGYAKTEIEDSTLSVGGCNSTSATFDRICTITDPLNVNGDPLIDGNPFQHVPEWTLNLELDYNRHLASGSSVFVYLDWKFKGETSDFLYESVEYKSDGSYEGGLRAGWRSADENYEVALYGRNITDEENIIGGIDFVNLTGYVNEPAVWGIEGTVNF